MSRSVDNFSLLKDLYEEHPKAECQDHFLFGQIMARKKDGAKYVKSNNRIIKDVVFRTPEDFYDKKDEIIELCKLFNARAYVNPNPRSYKDVCIEMSGLCLDYIRKGSEVACRSSFSTVCGRIKTKGGLWIVDVDDLKTFEQVSSLIPNKFQFAVPTVNGSHILTHGFDSRELKEKFPEVDIHRNNPTLLYYGG